MSSFPALPSLDTIQDRLKRIFPEGTPHRGYCTREMAAKTIFVMLYVGALADEDSWIRPDQVTRMTDEQASRQSDSARRAWRDASLKPKKESIPGRWYATNTREPIRDETIRTALIPLGAVQERKGLATTSPKPRYGLTSGFAALFDPSLEGSSLTEQIRKWQSNNLTPSARARVKILRQTSSEGDERILVTFPGAETRRMDPGPSSNITKAVVEEFAPRFLTEPRVVFLSESRNKVVARDDELARSIGLEIEADRRLPDVILVDLVTPTVLVVFVEVVATDGPISEDRKRNLLSYATEAGFGEDQVAFVTAYADRSDSAFRTTMSVLAWNSFAWFMSEPSRLIHLWKDKKDQATHLIDFLG